MEWIQKGDKEILELNSPYQNLYGLAILFILGNYGYFIYKSNEVNLYFHLVHLLLAAACLFLYFKKTELIYHPKDKWLQVKREKIPISDIEKIKKVVTHGGTRIRTEVITGHKTIKIPSGKNFSDYSNDLINTLKKKLPKKLFD
jgi:hypothetical protein